MVPPGEVVIMQHEEPIDLMDANWDPLVFGDAIPGVAGEHEGLSDVVPEP